MFAIAAIVIVSLVGVFLCSLSEAALYAVSHARIETLKRRKLKSGATLAQLRERVEEPIAAILIVNTVMMTLGAIWSGALVEKHHGGVWMGVFSAAFTLLILFLSEIIPKSVGVRFADTVSPKIARPLVALIWLLTPFVRFAVILTRVFGKSSRVSHPTEQDIISMTLLSEAGGKILKQEAGWIRNILRLNELKTKDIMTPHDKIKRIWASLPLSDVKTDWDHWRYSRILVTPKGEPDNIIGLVLRRRVFAALVKRGPNTTMADLLQPIHFIQDDKPAHELVSYFVKEKTQIAAVKNADGKLVGVVTMEDVLEDMIGAEID